MLSKDYEMLEEKSTALVAKDEISGATLAYDWDVKNPGDGWVVRQLACDL